MDRIPGAGGASRSRLDASCKADILIYDGYGILRYRRSLLPSSVLVLPCGAPSAGERCADGARAKRRGASRVFIRSLRSVATSVVARKRFSDRAEAAVWRAVLDPRT